AWGMAAIIGHGVGVVQTAEGRKKRPGPPLPAGSLNAEKQSASRRTPASRAVQIAQGGTRERRPQILLRLSGREKRGAGTGTPLTAGELFALARQESAVGSQKPH